MSGSRSNSGRNPVEALAEEFLERKRRGEPVTPEEYAQVHPELADEILAVFPALLMMEDLGGDSGGDRTGSIASGAETIAGATGRLGEFRLLRQIGRGGMGIVYEAEQESLGRRVALKVVPANMLTDPQQVRRFEREARSAAKLHHTHIVPVFGVGHHEGTHFYVMQFIQGQGLDAVLEELRHLRDARSTKPAVSGHSAHRGAAADIAVSMATGHFAAGPDGQSPALGATLPLFEPTPQGPGSGPSPSDSGTSSLSAASGVAHYSETDRRFAQGVARIGVQVAEALAYAHAQGILHRDIKPSNLLLDRDGNVWVADFGLAKAICGDDLTQTGDIIGTVRYMAPERFQGVGDARADVYSLGLTLYELLALRPAFEEKDRASLIRQVTQEEPRRLRKLNRKVPSDLETVVHKAMAREPAQRYQTAAALADDLKRFIEGRPIQARRVSAAEKAWRWCKRDPWLASLSAALALVLVVVAVGSTITSVYFNRLAGRERAAKKEAVDRAEEIHRGLVRLSVANGARLLDEGDLFGALPWFAEALGLDQGNPAREEPHRIRLAAVQRQCPKLLQHWTHGGLVRYAAFSPDGRRVVTASFDGTARVLDVLTGETVIILRHRDPVFYAAFSPDGRRVVTASGDWGRRDGEARVWDAATGRPVSPPLKHTGEGPRKAAYIDDFRGWFNGWINCAVFSPDGRWVVTASGDGTARVWDIATGRPSIPPLQHDHHLRHAEFSPDGRCVLTAGADAARVWDAATGRPITPPIRHGGDVLYASFSPDGRRIVTASWDGTAQVWDPATGGPLTPPMKHRMRVIRAVFSPDGRRVLTASADQTAQLWDAATGQFATPPLKHRHGVHHAGFSPDGRRVITASEDNTARVWDAATGQPLSPPLRHGNVVEWAALDPVGRRAITASRDGTTRLWDLASGDLSALVLKHTTSLSDAAFSPDGRRIVTAVGDGTARVWDLTTGLPIGPSLHHVFSVHGVAFSPDGRRVVTASGWDRISIIEGEARVWDAATGKPLTPPMKHDAVVWRAVFSADGRRVATASGISAAKQGEARVWDAATGEPVTPPLRHRGAVRDIAFSPDGRRVITGSHDGTARVWDAATGKPLTPSLEHATWIVSVAFSPDGRRALTSTLDESETECEAQAWDVATGKRLGEPMRHRDGVYRAAFSPDGRRVVTASEDSTARIWDAATGRPTAPPLEHNSYVLDAAFSPDGRLVASATFDGMARVWDAASGQLLISALKHEGGGAVARVAFSPDGRRLVTAGRDGTARVWDLPLTPEDRPVADLLLEARLLTGHRPDSSGSLRPLEPEALQDAWDTLRPRYPGDFATSPEEELAWSDREARSCKQDRQWAAALRHLDRLIAARPAYWPDRLDRGQALAELERWGEAADDFEQALALGADGVHAWLDLAMARLGAGQIEKYRQVCARLLERHGASENHQAQWTIVLICALSPDAVADYSPLIRMAEAVAARVPKHPYPQIALGAVLDRAGRFGEAGQHLNAAREASTGEGLPPDWLQFALIHHRLGHDAESRAWYEKAVGWLDHSTRENPRDPSLGTPVTWEIWLWLQLLRSEAEAVILYDPAFPADPFAH